MTSSLQVPPREFLPRLHLLSPKRDVVRGLLDPLSYTLLAADLSSFFSPHSFAVLLVSILQ